MIGNPFFADIKILADASTSGRKLYFSAIEAMSTLSCNGRAEYITNMEDVPFYCGEELPAIAINGKIMYPGKVLRGCEILYLLRSMIHEENGCS